MLRKSPQRREIHDVAAGLSCSLEPLVDARGRAEDALVAAGMNDVIPHMCGRHQKVRDFVTLWWLLYADVPRMWGVARRASGRDQHRLQFVHELRQRERVPCATAPPQRC